jgi:flagellar biosynthesis protein FliR
MDILQISPGKFQDFLLVMTRVSCFFISAPFFGFKAIPAQVKILVSFFFSLMITASLPDHNYPISCLLELLALVMQQVVVGLLLGVVANFVFEGIRMAGELMDIQMGFGMANVIDPALNMRQTLFGEVNYLLAVLLFLTMNGHHLLFRALLKTFARVPLYELGFSTHFRCSFLDNFLALFVISLKIALPILVILLFIDVASGFISRLIPQLNIFVITFPFKIATGFIALIMLLPQILVIYRELILQMFMNLKMLF